MFAAVMINWYNRVEEMEEVMKKKRIIRISGLVLSVLTMLGACGTNEGPSERRDDSVR